MKKLICCFLLVSALYAGAICACAAKSAAAWLPEEYERHTLSWFSYVVANGEESYAQLYVRDEAGEYTRITYEQESLAAQTLTAAEYSLRTRQSALPAASLPGFTAAASKWMTEYDKEHSANYSISYIAPEFAFSKDSALIDLASEHTLFYSIEKGELYRDDKDEPFSKESGAFSIMFPKGGDAWIIVVTE